MGLCKCKHLPEKRGMNSVMRGKISSLLNIPKDGPVQPITTVTLRIVWHNSITEYILNLFIDYLFDGKKFIHQKDLESFYLNMMESSTEVRANIIMRMIGTRDGVHPRAFHKFIVNLIESYIDVLRITNPEAFYTWLCGDDICKSDMKNLARYCTKDVIYSENGRMGIKELEKWLMLCSFATDIFESVIRNAFNMNDLYSLQPVLPKADKYTSMLRIPQVLLLSHLTKHHSVGEWRQIYCSWTDAHSWVILQMRIIGKGPSIVFIEDIGGVLFGGFASESWKISSGFYGDRHCFIFRLRPDFVVCTASKYNNHYQYLYDGVGTFPKGLAFGGSLNFFGIFVSSEFGPGRVSETCSSFNDYQPMTTSEEFYFSRIEVWAISNPEKNETAQKANRDEMDVHPVVRAAARLLEREEGSYTTINSRGTVSVTILDGSK